LDSNSRIWPRLKGLQDYYLISSGVYIKVNNRSDTPNVNYGGITVQTGVFSSVEVRREVYNNMPYPFSSCRKDLTELSSDSKYFKLTSQLGKYTRLVCMDIYKQINGVLNKCQCYQGSFKMNIDARICQNTSEISRQK